MLTVDMASPSGAEAPPRSGDLPRHFLTLVAVLGLVYSSTVFLPYALNDENWIVRASGWWARFDIRQGRPLFSLAILATSRVHSHVGWGVMPLLRVGAIVGIAAAMTMISMWLQWWGIPAAYALITGLFVASLPPFQVYVADATWLVLPFAATVAAVLMLRTAFDSHNGTARLVLCGASAMLVLLSLAFYQPAILIGLGLLIVPVLAIDIEDRSSVRGALSFVAFVIVVFALVTVVYYLTWLSLYRLERIVGDPYYSATALNADVLGRLRYFVSYRLLQAANLWHVDSVKPTAYAYATIVLIVVGTVIDLAGAMRGAHRMRRVAHFLLKYAAAVLVLLASDAIPLMARSPVPSYVTAPALFFVVGAWLLYSTRAVARVAASADQWLRVTAAVTTAAGLGIAQYTVLTYFSLPLFLEQRLVKGEIIQYLATHDRVTHVHVIGRKTSLLNHGLHEFGWSNATFDVYIRDMVKNVLDDVGLPSEVDVTSSGSLATALPRAAVPSADSAVIIDLSRIHLN